MSCPDVECAQYRLADIAVVSAATLRDTVAAAATAVVAPGRSCPQVHHACDSHSYDGYDR